MLNTFSIAISSSLTKITRVVQKAVGKKFVHFLHIRKTGGTAIKHALRQHLTNRRYVILLHPHRIGLNDIPAGEVVIFFVRDPISRFVSGFNSRQRQGRPRNNSPWKPEEKTAFSHFGTPNQLAAALSSVDTEDRARAENAMKSISHVNSSFWDWFESEEYLRSRLSDIFFVGTQERLQDDFEILKKKLGLPNGVSLPSSDVNAHRNPQSADTSLGPESLRNLKNWYRSDYQFLTLLEELIEGHNLGESNVIRLELRRSSAFGNSLNRT